MRISVTLPMSESDGTAGMPTWPEILAFAQQAEEIGLDSVWACDHVISGSADEEPEGIHEAWTIVSALAATTSRIELGQLVMCSSFRNPALLAKMAVTADTISGGRLTLGLGAGWYDAEYKAFGWPTDHRVDRFEEALQIITPLLRGERVTFDGRHHQTQDAVLMPPPDRQIPLMIAARRPRMLGLTARYADAWNTAWFGAPDERLKSRLAEFDAAMSAEGRDSATVRRTVGMIVQDPDAPDAEDEPNAFRGSVEELAAAIDAYATLGIDDLILLLLPMTERSLTRLAEALPTR